LVSKTNYLIFNILFDLRIDLSDVTNLRKRIILKVSDMKCGIGIRNMNDEGMHQRIGGFRDVDIAMDGESQLDESQGN